MKQLCITFFSIFLLFSCQSKNEEKNAILSESNGKINNVSIIVDENLWNGEIGDSIRKKFAAPVDGLINEEPLFNLNQYPTKIFEGIVRKSRNIIIIEKSNRSGYSFKKNEFAKPQNVFYIVGQNNDEILAILEKKANEIIQSLKSSEITENQNRLKKALVDDKKVRDRFGIGLTIGHGYKYDMVKDKFLWIRKEFSTGYNSILVYEVPINFIENDSNVVTNIVKMRDSIGKQFIHGTLNDTWMVTGEDYSPYLFDIKIAGRKTFETKGNWYLKNDFMAGPFVNYAIKDEKNNRYLILEGFTYNPSKAKRDLVFELESIIKSVKFFK
ncbi:group I intron homing endonuclease [Flavobacterium sp. 316]|uniref:DUF4837 family protein n=1 Tax=Flavobacterium sediminilitoris TaxID=2024526 RepID=A0ABY4HRF5_9FLAO|nr:MULTISPECIES: DUF4837 family protein [Flavobacterium]KIX20542.1 group I intron homing endonuclease [Flavobacterium sp. 316]UOX34892.1 DUF4837 family protein [Flavobacterium sediminilitoris]